MRGAPGAPLKLLRRHGANLEATAPGGYTALMLAARDGKADCAEALLEWGADKDAADTFDGNTTLHHAAKYGRLECARLLVRAWADLAKNAVLSQFCPVGRDRSRLAVDALRR